MSGADHEVYEKKADLFAANNDSDDYVPCLQIRECSFIIIIVIYLQISLNME